MSQEPILKKGDHIMLGSNRAEVKAITSRGVEVILMGSTLTIAHEQILAAIKLSC
jgi:hypothetical protein